MLLIKDSDGIGLTLKPFFGFYKICTSQGNEEALFAVRDRNFMLHQIRPKRRKLPPSEPDLSKNFFQMSFRDEAVVTNYGSVHYISRCLEKAHKDNTDVDIENFDLAVRVLSTIGLDAALRGRW
jgi:hypothetical protein